MTANLDKLAIRYGTAFHFRTTEEEAADKVQDR